jgi:hypothetical protein
MIVYVDVDDTLVRSAGGARIPMTGVIEHVKQLKSRGATLYLWSAGGADYCRSTAIELGIMIDDQEVKDWVFCTTFHPATCIGKKLEDYLRI